MRLNEVLKPIRLNAMTLLTQRHIVDRFQPQRAQAKDQQRRRRLPIDIEVPPDAHPFPICGGLPHALDCRSHVGQFFRGCWSPGFKVNQAPDLLRISQTAPDQQFTGNPVAVHER
jgi:hypothetical protein